MNGFIEITSSASGRKCFINIANIDYVSDKQICFQKHYLDCEESHEEIIQKIKQSGCVKTSIVEAISDLQHLYALPEEVFNVLEEYKNAVSGNKHGGNICQ